MILSLIVAMDRNNGIGYDNGLPWHIPEDLRFFRETTIHKPVIMGRLTYESIGRPLPDRTSIVLSRDPNYQSYGIVAVTSLQDALGLLSLQKTCYEAFVIGGSAIYEQALPLVDRMYVTHIDAEFKVDSYFPVIGDEWKAIRSTACITSGYPLKFNIYERKSTSSKREGLTV